jgi:hypothetical protein
LPEGKPDAQVLDGIITLAYPDLSKIQSRFQEAQSKLIGSKFDLSVERDDDSLLVTDPWGTRFRIVQGTDEDRDPRGQQPGGASEGLSLQDLTIYVPNGCNIGGIGRFYENVLRAPVVHGDGHVVVSVGPRQTLSFTYDPEERTDVCHVDLRDEGTEYLSNYRPHVSIYVADLPTTYEAVDALGIAYVNPRFKRRAYNLDQAIDDCMFRCLDIVDPDGENGDGPIIQLEHEIRSVTTRDGTKYKSCPFDNIKL